MTAQPPADRRQERADDGIAVWRTYSGVHARLAGHLSRELSRATGLSEADFQILDALLDAPETRMRVLDLRWELQWEKSRLSHHLARMCARGLLEREVCATDARGWDVTLTTAGRDAAERARRVREASVRRIVLDTLGPDLLDRLAEAADVLAERLERAAEEDPECRAARPAAAPGRSGGPAQSASAAPSAQAG
ncbi:MarR family winged helix-turn-helix transcriptional regulator [Marinitenerispora sediminis]|uniref:MarR family transcriptional regulator n=1 Tax=Marinitenerispora sediminis TaxID=1931232 RepID=A0A368T5Q9_9ACTN|nr:MarR family winged helix-turn-helix transcriptional regulator [Marinitenerispora sediminis]RCV56376.1 MarR family transcriptional regulator [Marinitenerispora sediminis]RCV57418.1 MarR family transcriptional regulator [Marinitenerispora sediminis]RCV58712.1 MarR family transcriptional regulator [Marinitenerispora sediminis]